MSFWLYIASDRTSLLINMFQTHGKDQACRSDYHSLNDNGGLPILAFISIVHILFNIMESPEYLIEKIRGLDIHIRVNSIYANV